MSEHPPQTPKTIEKTPIDEPTEIIRDRQFRDDQIVANYIHEHSGGTGVSSEDMSKLYEMLDDDHEADAVVDDSPENPKPGNSPEDMGEASHENTVDSARNEVEEALEDIKDEDSSELDDDESDTEVDEGVKIETEAEKKEKAELQKKIDAADKVQWPPERARQLRALAEQYSSLEAARKITKIAGSKNKNPLRYMRWLTGTDRSAHDRAMEDIAKSSTAHNEDRLIAAQAIIRGNGRNKVLAGVLTEMLTEKPKTALLISREMRGPSRAKYRKQLVSQYANSLGNEQKGLAVITDELCLDGPLSRHLKNILDDEQVKKLSKILDKLPSPKRDKAIKELAIQHKSLDLVKEIKSASVRREVRKELKKD